MTKYGLILAYYRSGQISEHQWQEHFRDEKLRQWLERQGFGHLT